jgi:rhodanese-related sulfurtransferase
LRHNLLSSPVQEPALKSLVAAAALACAFAAPAAFACEGEGHNAARTKPKKVTVAEVLQIQKADKALAVDANSVEFRAKNGVIPGAIQLTSSSQYEPAKELPQAKDTRLFFYCAGEKCSSSHTAATKAIEAGYTNVMVMPEGMTGWKKAGQKTAKPNS